MIKKAAIIAISLAVLLVIAASLFLHDSNEETDLPQATVKSILKLDYLAAYEKNALNPIRDDYYSQVTYPETGATFYKIAVKDQTESGLTTWKERNVEVSRTTTTHLPSFSKGSFIQSSI